MSRTFNIYGHLSAEEHVFDQPYANFQKVIDDELEKLNDDFRKEFKAEYIRRNPEGYEF